MHAQLPAAEDHTATKINSYHSLCMTLYMYVLIQNTGSPYSIIIGIQQMIIPVRFPNVLPRTREDWELGTQYEKSASHIRIQTVQAPPS
jgi:hypothetical protein